MNALARALGRFALVASLALVAACDSENRLKRVDFSYETSPPNQVTANSVSIIIRAGQAVAVRAHPVMSEDPLEDDDRFEMRSSDESTLGVDEGDEPFLFVLYGVAAGSASVQPFVNGRGGPVINATVIDVP
jgi:hypothetical protein